MKRLLSGLLLVLFSVSPVHAQWERIVVYWEGETGIHRDISSQSSPHPLEYFLTPSPERDSVKSLCLGCPLDKHGRKISLQDYDVEKSQRSLGKPFDAEIIEVILTFRAGREMQEINQQESHSSMGSEPLQQAQWKSILMQSGPDSYRELYFLIDNGTWNPAQSRAQLLQTRGIFVLETVDSSTFSVDDCFADGRWVVRPSGPWLIDFSPVEKGLLERIPAGAEPAGELACNAISMQDFELSSLIQKKCTGGHCDYIGTETVKFQMDGRKAVPESAEFKAMEPQ
jgi:hypothetical protein